MKNNVVMQQQDGILDDSGIRMLRAQDVKLLAGSEQTVSKYVKIIMDFFTSDGILRPVDVIETFFWDELRLIRNYEDRGHKIRIDSICDKYVDLHGLMDLSSREDWNEFLSAMNMRTGRTSQFYSEDISGVCCYAWTA